MARYTFDSEDQFRQLESQFRLRAEKKLTDALSPLVNQVVDELREDLVSLGFFIEDDVLRDAKNVCIRLEVKGLDNDNKNSTN